MRFARKSLVSLSLIIAVLSWGCTEPPGATATRQPGDQRAERPSDRCDSLRQVSPPGFDLDVVDTAMKTLAANAHSDVPEDKSSASSITYCEISGAFEKRIGVAGQPYAIGFRLALPENWNGRLLFQGGGGMNGVAKDPIGAFAAGSSPGIARGFAVITTDSGHRSDTAFDTSFFADQRALLNFYGRAVVRTTQLAQFLTSSFYGEPPAFSYFAGCSTGGREGLTMAQRYPELFDGIVVGSPAIRTNLSEIADLWAAKTLQSVIPAGAEKPFTDQEQGLIVDSLLAQCDARDGIADGLIMDVTGCEFDPSSIQCPAGTGGKTCLTAPQVKALQTAFAGPKTPEGQAVYPGFFYDTGISAGREGGIPGLLQGIAGPLGLPRMNEPFNLPRELALAEASPLAPGNATLTNLSTFALEGNKLIIFHGVSDPWFSAKDSLRYFEEMTQENGGEDTVGRWSQFYLVPGMGHCRGGEQALDNFDMLSALVDWVEEDRTPTHVVASGDTMPGISRPLCPFPKVAHYSETGDSAVARHFECR